MDNQNIPMPPNGALSNMRTDTAHQTLHTVWFGAMQSRPTVRGNLGYKYFLGEFAIDRDASRTDHELMKQV